MARSKSKQTRRKILIVDDHPIMRHGLAQLIAETPDLAVCAEAGDVSEALKQVKATAPDVAVIDISLEAENGIELIQQIKIKHPRVKTLVSSIHDETIFAPRALQADARGYIHKSEAIRKIIDALRDVLRGKIYLSPRMAERMLHRAAGGEPMETNPVDALSNRELEIFEMVGHGVTTQHIARKLKLSHKTVETHRRNIRAKLKLVNSAQLSRHAFQWVQEDH